MNVRILHLVWAPLGPAQLHGFLDALETHPPGVDAPLTVILNGFDGPADAWTAGRGLETLHLDAPQQDLGAYSRAAATVTEPLVCLMNSYARPRGPGWLAALQEAVASGFAAAGATGSWESLGSELRLRDRMTGPLRDRLGGAYDWVAYRRRFPRFPNPHLRTNGMLVPREALLDWAPADKAEAYAVESGRHGLNARLDGELAVVGLDGVAHRWRDWATSRTFRSGEQENLLIADNRTAEWDTATGADRSRMRARVWGP